jgi:GTP:adenosylcobinamide-phosphate guanylyltransferase
MHKPVISLLMARGMAEAFAAMNGPKYKALLPVNGKPMADYVLRSLQGSLVEMIFIAQAPDQHLQDILTMHPKNIFLSIEGQYHSLAWSLARSLEQIADYYEAEALNNYIIMITPCDIPLVNSNDFNKLIFQAQSQNADALLTIIPHRIIKDAYPYKRFQKLYHADIKQAMSMQSIVFMSGGLLRIKPEENPDDYRLVILDSIGQPVPCLDKMIDLVRRGRHSLWLWPNFLYQVFFSRMIANGKSIDVFRLIIDIILRRMTVNKIHHYLYMALGINFGAVRSHTGKFSGDIDTLQDLRLLSPLLLRIKTSSKGRYCTDDSNDPRVFVDGCIK